jgi:hypothetical protein
VGRIAYTIPDELHFKAKSLAALKGVSLKAWIEHAMAAEIERQEAGRAPPSPPRRSTERSAVTTTIEPPTSTTSGKTSSTSSDAPLDSLVAPAGSATKANEHARP